MAVMMIKLPCFPHRHRLLLVLVTLLAATSACAHDVHASMAHAQTAAALATAGPASPPPPVAGPPGELEIRFAQTAKDVDLAIDGIAVVRGAARTQRIRIFDVMPGAHTLVATMRGRTDDYARQTDQFTIAPGQRTTVLVNPPNFSSAAALRIGLWYIGTAIYTIVIAAAFA